MMDEDTKQIYEWALNQDYPSVSARHAKTLALYIQGQDAKINHLNQLCNILLAYANGSITRAEMEAAIKNR